MWKRKKGTFIYIQIILSWTFPAKRPFCKHRGGEGGWRGRAGVCVVRPGSHQILYTQYHISSFFFFFFSYQTKYPVSWFCISKMCGLPWLIDKNNFHNDKTFDDTQSYVTLEWNVCLIFQVSLWIQCWRFVRQSASNFGLSNWAIIGREMVSPGPSPGSATVMPP